MTAVSRLFGRTLLRPGPSLLLLGAAILASNWVWYGSGIFLGQRAGLALTIAGLLGFGYAAYGLVRGRHQLLALSIFIVAAVLLPALALLALRSTTGAPLLMHDGAYQTEEAIKLIFDFTRGTPREINNLCDVALLVGFSKRATEIGDKIIAEVIKDMVGVS